ncbi:uncharacterized protein NPIL_593871 [Nephila pilipes]|uniref:Uncharacterized protein n=1 Tax=Nephila pilipes TaxID=299642 RepID=A0A8X6TKR1_NEPPI|nr:uncharacterized protein NPIL_593871 [Nephila pilipes]
MISSGTTESPIEIQECIDSNFKLSSTPLIDDIDMKNIQLSYTYKESTLHTEEIITQLSSASVESPSQFCTEPVKSIIQDVVCIVCSKATSNAHKERKEKKR